MHALYIELDPSMRLLHQGGIMLDEALGVDNDVLGVIVWILCVCACVCVGSCLATKDFIGNLPAMGRGWVIIK